MNMNKMKKQQKPGDAGGSANKGKMCQKQKYITTAQSGMSKKSFLMSPPPDKMDNFLKAPGPA